MKKTMLLLTVILMIAGTAAGAMGKDGAQTAPADYGKVIMNTFSQKEGLAPVVFDHWLHRAKYTCRLCHVDIGFALKAGTTGVRAADNMKGMYCGVCHNGKTQDGDRKVFQACSAEKSGSARCDRCHSQGKSVKKDYDFGAFTAKFPREKFGNGVNWEKAASDGLVKPIDYIEGVSIKKPAQAVQTDFAIHPKASDKGDIIFSHKKHVLWNGCEVCHPDIFKGGKRGSTKYSMDEIKEGKFCGVCHSTVSFPIADCARCHSQPVK
jgi:c(7)-type cytochrome triheme protein